MADKIKKKDFIEIKYTGYANNQIFDSNIEEDIKSIDQKAKPQKTIIAVGEEMVLKGLDEALEGKEPNKEYEITIPPEKAFGERKRDLIKTIPLKAFTEKKVNPYPGLVLTLDNAMVKIITISGARVITDFNNPLAGKEIKYKFTITRIVKDEKEKAEALFLTYFRFLPEFELKDKIIVKGPKTLEQFTTHFKEKFKNLLNKELAFEEKTPETLEKKVEEKKPEETTPTK